MTDTVERTEVLSPGPGLALASLLGVEAPDLVAGEPLPVPWHWIYLLERPAQADIGPDGHPARGGIPVPPGPGRRRMWAAGTVTRSGPLRCGEPATRHTRILSSQEKEGRSGRMTFVKVGHDIEQAGRVVVREEQDIVYRDAVTPTVAPTPQPPPAVADRLPVGEDEWEVRVDPTVLFRFSALTYNAHRIHYDRDFARDVEGYAGLVVHGPLQATIMCEAARRRGALPPDVPVRFEFRLQSPLLDHQGLVATVAAEPDGLTTSVRDWTGRVSAVGSLRIG